MLLPPPLAKSCCPGGAGERGGAAQGVNRGDLDCPEDAAEDGAGLQGGS